MKITLVSIASILIFASTLCVEAAPTSHAEHLGHSDVEETVLETHVDPADSGDDKAPSYHSGHADHSDIEEVVVVNDLDPADSGDDKAPSHHSEHADHSDIEEVVVVNDLDPADSGDDKEPSDNAEGSGDNEASEKEINTSSGDLGERQHDQGYTNIRDGEGSTLKEGDPCERHEDCPPSYGCFIDYDAYFNRNEFIKICMPTA
jgi:hypothetical protein